MFVAEDDLWLVSASGGRAERLTAGVGEVSSPRFSPDGHWLAFVGCEEGPSEVYVMPANGGQIRRLTYDAGECQVLGWSQSGDEVLYASNAHQFSPRYYTISAVALGGGMPRELPLGQANAIAYGPQGGIVLGRNIRDMARWKRYRGGTVGHLWCDAKGSGTFQRFLHVNGNVADPCWVGDRIYFLSDYEGVGNLYSCTPAGEDVQRHTNHEDFYARSLASDGERLIYHAGAELYLYDPAVGETRQLSVELPSIRTQRNRKFVSARRYLDTYALHPQGHKLALTTRGKAFSLGNWEGPVLQHGEPDGVRYRFLEWLNDGKRYVAVCDAPGREVLVIFDPEQEGSPNILSEIAFGRVVSLSVSPTNDVIVLTNHRNELVMVDLATASARVLDRSETKLIRSVSWSPDGRWLAYGFGLPSRKTAIKLCEIESGQTHQITEPILHDVSPSFDPKGKCLYFLGYRLFHPTHDNMQFELGFPRGVKPYAMMLQRDTRSPFGPEATPVGEKGEEGKKEEESKDMGENKKQVVIDLEGIAERVVPFPVDEGCFLSVVGIKGKALLLSVPEGEVEEDEDEDDEENEPRGRIDAYDFETKKRERVLTGVNSFTLSRDCTTLVYHSHERLRVLKAGEKPKEDKSDYTKETGWIDLGRVKVSVSPPSEWRQMFAEAWRLQREQFWVENMSGVDWEAVYRQYAPLVERVASRSELSDLLWEMLGELGTSHAYEVGGEYRAQPHYHQGFLGVDWSYDTEQERYRIAHLVKGDPSENETTSPLLAPGLGVAVGDAVLSINGQRVSRERTPQALLVNQSGHAVQVTIEKADTQEQRSLVVNVMESEWKMRYREWVKQQRHYVHTVSDGRVGYVHIPDMGVSGFGEFHRSYLAEYDYPALLIDVRWNNGGFVAELLLEKLARRRIGRVFPRWNMPFPFPQQSPRGPMVALMNEQTASNGDIFSHSFKLMGLGPLIGKRSWGGVIGYVPRHWLVDETMTTQPEYAYWFKDVGWNIENYGTDPDIEVDVAPQDYAKNIDPQLDRAIAEALKMIEERPTLEPQPGERPYLGRS
ncbi:S41 family peptidase [Reticulibacter mediterranei]|uniref:S41 family peptidase n=1 Tax=Reticulibacter mediterranei TaxID=2778369 RepID=UPI001F264557|nr:S41 family peptidase [Reticulibacter mediterranei]